MLPNGERIEASADFTEGVSMSEDNRDAILLGDNLLAARGAAPYWNLDEASHNSPNDTSDDATNDASGDATNEALAFDPGDDAGSLGSSAFGLRLGSFARPTSNSAVRSDGRWARTSWREGSIRRWGRISVVQLLFVVFGGKFRRLGIGWFRTDYNFGGGDGGD